MKIIKQYHNSYLLRFDRNEEFISTLQNFCAENNITAGYFQGLGACGMIELAWYNLESKAYEVKKIDENLEITSLTGNISVKNKKIYAHTHGVFGNNTLEAITGHVKSMTISATCEVKLDTFDGTIEREQDNVTGLNLMK